MRAILSGAETSKQRGVSAAAQLCLHRASLLIRAAVVAALTFIAAFVAACVETSARADDQPTLSGQWSATGLSETWSTSEWGDGCGQKPKSQGASGGTVTITEQGGELAMSGGGRNFTTAQCWEQMPGLSRSSHSAGKRGWSTRCTSAAGDPRHAVVVTNVVATDDTIQLQETGNYEFFVEGSTCRASVSRSRGFKLQQRAGETPPAPSASAAPAAKPPPPPPPPSEPSACGEPGAPVRLEVRPSKKLLRPGEDFTFKAAALDAKGCLTGKRPTFKVEDAPSGSEVAIDEHGKVTVGAGATEGVTSIVAELGGKTVKLTVEVAGKDRYDALLKERGFNAQGEDDTAATVEISAGVGGSETKADDVARARKQIFVGIVAGLAAVLALVGFILTRRGKRPDTRKDPAAEEEESVEPGAVAFFEKAVDQPMRCPKCGEIYAPEIGFCKEDGSPLVPATGIERVSAPVSSGPASSAGGAESSPSSVPKKKALEKICPTCGDRFESSAAFCGKDGTSLVPIN